MNMNLFEKLSTPVEKLGLSTRTINCLKNGGYNVLYDFCYTDPYLLTRLSGYGKTCQEETLAKIKELNISPCDRLPFDDDIPISKDIPINKLGILDSLPKRFEYLGDYTVGELCSPSPKDIIYCRKNEYEPKLMLCKEIWRSISNCAPSTLSLIVSELGFPPRLYNTLRRRLGAYMLGDLRYITEKEVIYHNGFGIRSYKSIIEKMEEMNVSPIKIEDDSYDITFIKDQNLSLWTCICLWCSGYFTIESLKELSTKDIERINGLGKKGSQDVIFMLKMQGIELAFT